MNRINAMLDLLKVSIDWLICSKLSHIKRKFLAQPAGPQFSRVQVLMKKNYALLSTKNLINIKLLMLSSAEELPALMLRKGQFDKRPDAYEVIRKMYKTCVYFLTNSCMLRMARTNCYNQCIVVHRGIGALGKSAVPEHLLPFTFSSVI